MFVKGGGYVPKLGKLVQMLHLFFELAPVNHVVSLSLISLKSQFKQQLETNFYAGSGTLYGWNILKNTSVLRLWPRFNDLPVDLHYLNVNEVSLLLQTFNIFLQLPDLVSAREQIRLFCLV